MTILTGITTDNLPIEIRYNENINLTPSSEVPDRYFTDADGPVFIGKKVYSGGLLYFWDNSFKHPYSYRPSGKSCSDMFFILKILTPNEILMMKEADDR